MCPHLLLSTPSLTCAPGVTIHHKGYTETGIVGFRFLCITRVEGIHKNPNSIIHISVSRLKDGNAYAIGVIVFLAIPLCGPELSSHPPRLLFMQLSPCRLIASAPHLLVRYACM